MIHELLQISNYFHGTVNEYSLNTGAIFMSITFRGYLSIIYAVLRTGPRV